MQTHNLYLECQIPPHFYTMSISSLVAGASLSLIETFDQRDEVLLIEVEPCIS